MSHKILVLDDDPVWGQTVQLMLEQAGYMPLAASCPETALQWLRELNPKPNAIMLDIDLTHPKWDGLKICSEIKKNPRTRMIPVIVVSGMTGNAPRIDAHLVRAELFLSKPVSQDELLRAIKEVLETPRVRKGGAIKIEDFEIDPDRNRVSFHGTIIEDFSGRLFDVLYLLADGYPNPIMAERILSAMRLIKRKDDAYVMVSRLRKFLENKFGAELVATVPEGYRLRLPAAAKAS